MRCVWDREVNGRAAHRDITVIASLMHLVPMLGCILYINIYIYIYEHLFLHVGESDAIQIVCAANGAGRLTLMAFLIKKK